MTTRLLQLRARGPALLTGLLLFGPQANAGEEHQLSNGEIKRLITGKVVTDEVHYTDYFKAGGAYEGVFMNKRLTGTWKVKGGPALHHPRIRG